MVEKTYRVNVSNYRLTYAIATHHPNAPACHDTCQDGRRDADIRFAKHTQVKQQNRELGATERNGIQDFHREKVLGEVRSSLGSGDFDVLAHSAVHP